MPAQHSTCYESSQEEIDLDTLVADINAAVDEGLAAARREPTLEERRRAAWRVVYAIDHLFGLTRHSQTADEFARAQTWLEELNDQSDPWQSPANDGTPFEWELDDGLETEEPTPALDIVLDLRSGEEPVRQSENRRPRRSHARDRRGIERSTTCFEEELARAGRPLVRTPSSSSPTPSPTTHTLKTPSSPSNDNDRRGIASWKDTKEFGRFAAMNRALTLNDDGGFTAPYAFTLNLSPDVIARALASRHNGFASYLQKRIAAEIAKVIRRVVDFVFSVDVTRSGRPHLHGVVAANDNELPAIEEALRRAGGSWAAKCAARQVDTRPVWNADGWSSYAARNAAAARKVVGASVMACTYGLKSAAKALHEHLRQSNRAAA